MSEPELVQLVANGGMVATLGFFLKLERARADRAQAELLTAFKGAIAQNTAAMLSVQDAVSRRREVRLPKRPASMSTDC